MVDINFLTSNPAIDEFNRGNKLADERATSELNQKRLGTEIAAGEFNLKQSQAEGPTRLRQLEAGANLATTQAQNAQATARFAVPQAQAQLEQVHAQTAAALSTMDNAKARRDLDALTKELALLDAGDIDGAKRIAASVGDTIPDEYIQNAQKRAAVKNIITVAEQTHQGNPKLIIQRISAQIAAMGQQQQNGQPINPQTAPYQNVPGAPEIPESTAKPVNVPAGGTLVDPGTGKPIYQSTATKWGIIGYDEYGNPIHGYPPPSGGAAPGANPQQPMAPAGGVPQVRPQSALQPGGQPISQPSAQTASADPTTINSGVASDLPGNPTLGIGTAPPERLHGAEYLKTLRPGEADLVQGIAENRINPNSLSIRGGHRERILQMVAQYKEDYNQTLYSGAQSYQRTAGGAGARIEFATNEVAQALPLAVQASRNLPRGRFVPWNELVQKWEQKTSDPAYNDFITKNFALITAYTRAMNPLGVPRITERLEQHAAGILNAATSPEAYEVQARAIWQEVQRSRAAVAQTRGGVGPSANEAASIEMPMPGSSAGAPAQGGAVPPGYTAAPGAGGGVSPKPSPPPAGAPPNARQAPDGNWYVPDPNRPGKYLQVVGLSGGATTQAAASAGPAGPQAPISQ